MKLKTRLEERDGQTVFVINRKEWGTGPDGGLLWSEDKGKGCCLGLAALVEGAPVLAVRGCSMPASVIYAPLPDAFRAAWLRKDGRNRSVAIKAAEINDQSFLVQEEREELLRPIFRKARGWLVEFED